MANRTQLTVEILTDTAKAARGIEETAGKFESFGKKAAGFIAGAFAVDKIGDGVRAVINAASDMQQAVGGTDLIFKGSADVIHAWASDTSDDFRVPAVAAEKYAATMGNALMQSGRSTSDAALETKKLAQVAADLASAYGGDVVQALDAVNAAISKGEWERLESFGVTIKAADVSAEMDRIADSMGGLSSANEAAIRTQASINLLMKEAAPALGAAASESQTFSARVDSLKEKLNNMAGEVGGPLLDAVGGLTDSFAEMLPLLEPIAGVLTTIVAAVASVPAPVLAAAAGFGLLVLAGGKVGPMLATMGAAMTAFRAEMIASQAAATASGTSMSTLAAAASTAGTRIKTAFLGAFAAMGGLPGLLIAAALTVVTVGLFKFAEAAARAKTLSDNLKTSVDGIATALQGVKADEISGVGREASLAALRTREWGRESSSLVDYNDRLGVSLGTVLDAMQGVPGASDAIEAAYQKQRKAQQDIIDQAAGLRPQERTAATNAAVAAAEENVRILDEMHSSYDGLIGIQDKAIAQNEKEKAALDGVASSGAYVSQMAMNQEWAKAAQERASAEATAAAEKEAEAQKKLGEEIKKAQDAADKTGGARFLASIKGETENAQRALEIFTGVLDDFTAKTESTDNATLQWNDNLRSTAEAFKKAAEAGTLSGDAVAAFDVNALASTETGSALAKALLAQADAYNQNVVDAYQAAGGATNYMEAIGKATTKADESRAAFIGMATAAGMLPEQAEAAANSLGILAATQIPPLVFQLIAEDSEARAVVGRLQNEGVDPITMEILAGADGAKGTFDDTLSYMNSEGIAMPPIPLHADPAPAEGVVDEFTGQKIQTSESMVNINGNTIGVNNALRAVMGGHYPVEMTINGNTLNVNNALRAVMGGMYPVMMQIHGDSGPVNNTIRAVIGGSYSLTVSIKANADAFYQVYNALPTSKTITQQVVTVPAPPVAAPVGFAGGRVTTLAPQGQLSLARMSSTADAGLVRSGGYNAGAGTTVNVNGALDPDAVARQIASVLRTHARRTGGVTVGTAWAI